MALPVSAAPGFLAGERHLTVREASAVPRSASRSDVLRVTVWYPAAADSQETSLDIGPPDAPLFHPGSAAQNAPFADKKPRPVILFSHGFGGSARMMAWFGTALARAGYIVLAPDHPGNSAADQKTLAGSLMIWLRPGDLAAALQGAKADPETGGHMDDAQVAVAGYSAGGFTALAAAGGRVDIPHFLAFCHAHPKDGVCRPQKERPVTLKQMEAFYRTAQADGGQTLSSVHIPGVRGIFVMAPALVQALTPESLGQFAIPVQLVAGGADVTASPATNAYVAARQIPQAGMTMLPGVTHYDFLAGCGASLAGTGPYCESQPDARLHTHQKVIGLARDFFARTLIRP